MTAVVLGILLTAISMVGIKRKRVPALAHLGLDSWLVLVLYVLGIGDARRPQAGQDPSRRRSSAAMSR